MTCRTNHHLACACREHKVAVLSKTALDAAYELRAVSNVIDALSHDEKEKIDQLIARLYSAVESLGESHIDTESLYTFLMKITFDGKVDPQSVLAALDELNHKTKPIT
jgi:hypothetical protein